MPTPDCSPLARVIHDLAMNIGSDPKIKDLDGVVAEMQKHIPEMDRKTVVDAIHEVGASNARDVSDLQKKLETLKREARSDRDLRTAIDDYQKAAKEGGVPPKTRGAPPEPTKAIAALRTERAALQEQVRQNDPKLRTQVQERISELEKHIAAGTVPKAEAKVPAPADLQALRDRRDELAAQMKKADPSRRQELRDQIKTLEGHLKAGTVPAKRAAPVAPPADIAKLSERRDALMEQVRRADPAKRQAIRDQIKELQGHIDAGTHPEAKPEATPPPTDVAALRAERDTLAATLRQDSPKAIADMKSRISELEGHLKAGTVPEKRASASLNTTDKVTALRVQRDQLLSAIRKSDPVIRQRFEKQIADLTARMQSGDFAPKPEPEKSPLSPQLQRMAYERDRLRQQINQRIDALQPRTAVQKAQKAWTNLVRFSALSYPTVFAKLTSAAVLRTVSTPIEQGVGAALSKAMPRLAERAPREGVPSFSGGLRAEAAAQVRMWTDGIRGSVAMLKNRSTPLELSVEPNRLPPALSDYLGRLHGAFKNPTLENEYARSLTLRTEHAVKNGVDTTDPMQQIRLSNEAYQDAKRSIFLQDNKVVDAWNHGLATLESPSKTTGKPTAAAYLAAALRTELPIVKVPTNVVHEATQVMTGWLTGPARAAFAYAKGIENLKPVEADAIMRQMKKGSIGAALLALGFFKSQNFGGYYQQGEKRKPDEPKPGDIGPVPALLLHNPYMEAMQFGANVRRIAEGRYVKSQADTNGFGSALAASALGLLDEVPFVRETSTIGKVMDPRTRDNAIGAEVAAKLVPGVVQWVAKQTDRDAAGQVPRKPQGTVQSVEAAIPGLRENVPQNFKAPR